MPLSADEQFLLELINRARLDPVAEAARYGIGLNDGLTAGTLQGGSRQVLAANDKLSAAALSHSIWMLQTDTFSHTGSDGSQPWDRAAAYGYDWSSSAENISWRGTSASSFDIEAAILGHHEGLFRSAGHRVNLVNDNLREVGLSRETGTFTSNNTNWNSSMLTELFGTSGSASFVTGVVYTDRDGDRFYSMGEGVGNTRFVSGSVSATSETAGGYALALAAGSAVSVTGTLVSGLAFAAKVDLRYGNVKLDIVNGTEFLSSGALTLVSGIHKATLLGLDHLKLTGSSASNVLTGNSGNNYILGVSGNDSLYGQNGNDTLSGGVGNDRLDGQNGNDWLVGGDGADRLYAKAGDDYLRGDGGNDIYDGGTGADRFVFRDTIGADTINNFMISERDRLLLDDTLWAGRSLTAAQVVAAYADVTAAGVEFDFGAPGSILLEGLTSVTGLAAQIYLI